MQCEGSNERKEIEFYDKQRIKRFFKSFSGKIELLHTNGIQKTKERKIYLDFKIFIYKIYVYHRSIPVFL